MNEKIVDIQTGGLSVKESDTKWLSIIFMAFAIIIGTALFLLNSDNKDIHHRLDVRDAYFNKGLIDLNKAAIEAYKGERKDNLELRELIRNNGVVLPMTLANPRPEANLSVESVLVTDHDHGGK